MEFNDYFVEWLVKQRLDEARNAAARAHLLAERDLRGATFRVTIGAALIRCGAWLLRERYPVRP